MKKTICFLFALFICTLVASSQTTETIKITGAEYPDFIAKTQYKYPEYTRAKISLKSGEIASARINYNNFLHMMKYIDEKGDTLEIANADDINYIAVGVDTIFYDKVYYDWVASSGVAKLAQRRTYKVISRALVGAFGTSSPAKDIVPITRILGAGTSYDLAYGEELTLSKQTIYYVSPVKGLNNNFVVANKKNLIALFPKKNIEDFIKENKINLNKEEDLIDVFIYLSKN
jgi:hypothetical protein